MRGCKMLRCWRCCSLRLSALLLILLALQFAVSSPLTFYSSYVLERRFELSTLNFGGWLWRLVKQGLVVGVISLVVVVGLYWIIWTVCAAWWLVAAAAFFVVSVVLGQLAPVLILPLFYHIEKLDVPGLTDRLARLAEGTGLSIEGVYRMDLRRRPSRPTRCWPAWSARGGCFWAIRC